MKTDKELYTLFSSRPDLLFECAEIEISEDYEMNSVTFKEFEQRSDGLLEPVSGKGPTYLVEFQGYSDDAIYHRLIMEMAAYGKTYPGRDIRGILVFTTSALDPKTSPWHELTKSEKDVFKIVYLDDFLEKLEKENPDHPLVAVFKPWIIEDIEILRADSKIWYTNIENSGLEENARENFTAVFIRWMQERFKNLSYEEVVTMFAEMTPLEETRSYKEIFAKGRTEGKAEGHTEGRTEGQTEGRIEIINQELKRLILLKSQNVLNVSLYEILSDPLQKELKYLEALRNIKKEPSIF